VTLISKLLFCALLFCCTLPAKGSSDPIKKGPFQVQVGEYRFPAGVDPDVLAHVATEIWGKAFWPKTFNTSRPILFFMHGNHGTCGTRSTPREDNSCLYTETGSCPAGMVVTPNHEGYDYLAQHLASHGYIVVSINANRGITCGQGHEGDLGLNLARGRLFLRHIELWRKWSLQGGSPASLKVRPDRFIGAVDLQNVGLFGHSRAGEGARAAYNLYRDHGSIWQTRIPSLKIKGIFEIGAVDGQTARVLDADDTAWNQLLPMCDGDVYDLQGRLPFERMIRKAHEPLKSAKSVYLAWGTNHNFFNSQWHENDSYDGCIGHDPIWGNGHVSVAQQKVALDAASAFFRAHVGHERIANLRNIFDPAYALPIKITETTRIERDFIPTFDQLTNVKLEDFDQATGINSHRFVNIAQGISIEHEAFADTSESVEKESAPIPHAKISWRTASDKNFLQIHWTDQNTGIDARAFDTFDFRVARQGLHTNTLQPTSFKVALVDEHGNLTPAVSAAKYAEIVGPVSETTVFQTVKIPVSDLLSEKTNRIKGARFIFDESAYGHIYLASIRFTGSLSPLSPMHLLRAKRTDVFLKPSPVGPSSQPTHGELPRERVEYRAQIKNWRLAQSTALWQGGHNQIVELSITSDKRFPIGAELPSLVVGEKTFSISRVDQVEGNRSLIFTIPIQELATLPYFAEMYVRYGRKPDGKIWRLPNYSPPHLED
jgi:hypothetical protein